MGIQLSEEQKQLQNKISKPFLYLTENKFVAGKKRKKEKSFYYSATDRIFVLYYHRREIYHNQNYTQVWLLSDFLLTIFQKNELKDKDMKALREKPSQDAIDMAKISLLAKGYNKNKAQQNWLIGQIGIAHLLVNDSKSAWQLLEKNKDGKEKIFKEFGDAIIFKEKKEGLAAGFKIANELLHGLKEREKIMAIPLSLSYLFSGLLSMKISINLLQDIAEEAKEIFSSPEAQIIISAVLHTLKFIEADKDPAYLEQLSPDEAIAIQAIVTESQL